MDKGFVGTGWRHGARAGTSGRAISPAGVVGLALMEAPETVREVHQAYVASGARVITTNSYALVPFHIGEARFAAPMGGWQPGRATGPRRGRRAAGLPCRWPVHCRRSLAPYRADCIKPSG